MRSELMDLLLRGAVRDPAAADCCITTVKMSDDLGIAKVYVRLVRGELDEQAQHKATSALNRAAPYLRRQLSPRLKLKYLPELRFYWDEGIDHASRIEALLAEIGREGPKP
jgi:ribosome-binding factor A